VSYGSEQRRRGFRLRIAYGKDSCLTCACLMCVLFGVILARSQTTTPFTLNADVAIDFALEAIAQLQTGDSLLCQLAIPIEIRPCRDEILLKLNGGLPAALARGSELSACANAAAALSATRPGAIASTATFSHTEELAFLPRSRSASLEIACSGYSYDPQLLAPHSGQRGAGSEIPRKFS